MSNSEQKSVRYSRLSPSLLLGITLLFPLRLLGAEQSTEQVRQPEVQQPEVRQPEVQQPEVQQPEVQQPEVQQPDFLAPIDAPRDYLSGEIVSLANDIDRFFGDDRNYQETNKSVVQLDLARNSGYGTDHKTALAGRVNLRLPATEGRFHLLLESDPEKNIVAEPTPNQTVLNSQVVAPASYSLAARYVKELQDVWHFSTDAGLKFPIPVHPFVRSRGSYSVPLSNEWRLKATESVYWFNNIGVGETTQLDLEHFLSDPALFRATSSATWLKDKQNFDLRQDLSIYHTVNERTALLYQASAIGVSNPQWELTEYVLSMLYRFRLHREWMYFELSPQLHFPKINNFESAFSLSVRLEILFDKSR